MTVLVWIALLFVLFVLTIAFHTVTDELIRKRQSPTQEEREN